MSETSAAENGLRHPHADGCAFLTSVELPCACGAEPVSRLGHSAPKVNDEKQSAEKDAGCLPALRCSDRPELCPPACQTDWHVAIHADSDSLFRHSGTLFDCRECRVFPPAKPEEAPDARA